jgi:DNA replication protein DnaC
MEPQEQQDEIKRKIRMILPAKLADTTFVFKLDIDDMAEKSLFIHGNEIVKLLVRKNKKVKFINVPKFMHELQRCFRNNGNPYDLSDDIMDYEGLVVFDDLGRDKSTEYVMQIVYCIVDQRNMNNRQTIITSNLTLAELSQKFDESISSRIAEMCDPFFMVGENRRLKK